MPAVLPPGEGSRRRVRSRAGRVALRVAPLGRDAAGEQQEEGPSEEEQRGKKFRRPRPRVSVRVARIVTR